MRHNPMVEVVLTHAIVCREEDCRVCDNLSQRDFAEALMKQESDYMARIRVLVEQRDRAIETLSAIEANEGA